MAAETWLQCGKDVVTIQHVEYGECGDDLAYRICHMFRPPNFCLVFTDSQIMGVQNYANNRYQLRRSDPVSNFLLRHRGEKVYLKGTYCPSGIDLSDQLIPKFDFLF